MKKSKEISRFDALPPSMDFAWLKERAIEFAQKYAGDSWTDYNAHDPGVTILELLAYALTDVGYRLHAPYQDILAPDPELDPQSDQARFFKGREMLTTYPFTLSDYRATLLDIEGVRNAWLERNGQRETYRTYFITEEGYNAKDVEAKIQKRLSKYRNIGDDFESIQRVYPYDIQVSAEISLEENVDPNEAMTNILYELTMFFNPEFRFRSLRSLMKEGHRVEDIFEGPKLKYGYLANADLEMHMPFTFQFPSHDAQKESSHLPLPSPHLLQERIQRLSEIKWIRKLSIEDLNQSFRSEDPQRLYFFNFNLWLKPTSAQTFFPKREGKVQSFTRHLQNIRLLDKQKLAVVKEATVGASLEKKLYQNKRDKSAFIKMETELKGNYLDFSPPVGKSRKLYHYHSIQHHFPQTYQLAPIPQDIHLSSKGRHHILQLRAFLLFLEQFIVNKLHLLNSIKYFFSVESDEKFRPAIFKDKELPYGIPFFHNWDATVRTFSAPTHLDLKLVPQSIPELEKLIHHPPLTQAKSRENMSWEMMKKQIEEAEDSYHHFVQQKLETTQQRDKRLSFIMDHFLATVGFTFDMESYRIFSLYNQGELYTRTNFHKRRILLNYPQISAARASGFDYQNIVLHPPSYDSDSLTDDNEASCWKLKLIDFQDLYTKLTQPSSPSTGQSTDTDIWGPEKISPENVSGFKLRLAHLLGINYWQNWRLTSFLDESLVHWENEGEVPEGYGFSFVGEEEEKWEALKRILLYGIEKKKYQIHQAAGTEGFQIRLHSQNLFSDNSNAKAIREAGKLNEYTEVAAVASFHEDVANFTHYHEALEIRDAFAHMLKRHRINSEGFYEVEAVLLASESQESTSDEDFIDCLPTKEAVPTAFAIYYIFPSWPSRFQSEGFKEVLSVTIHRELPAHLRPYILFLDPDPMFRFEDLYENWMSQLFLYKHPSGSTQKETHTHDYFLASQELKTFLNEKVREQYAKTPPTHS
ncbi:MAG: hypothetical protein AAFU33_11120 [Bacteroidota bacterium]